MFKGQSFECSDVSLNELSMRWFLAETLDHLFCQCRVAKEVWAYVGTLLDYLPIFTSAEYIKCLKRPTHWPHLATDNARTLLAYSAWELWEAPNMSRISICLLFCTYTVYKSSFQQPMSNRN